MVKRSLKKKNGRTRCYPQFLASVLCISAPKTSTKLQTVLSGVIIKMHVRVVFIMENKSTGRQVVPNS